MDHVHMLVSIPPKYSVAQMVGYVKGKSAIWVARSMGRNRNFLGQNFWARGYFVPTIGLDEQTPALPEVMTPKSDIHRLSKKSSTETAVDRASKL